MINEKDIELNKEEESISFPFLLSEFLNKIQYIKEQFKIIENNNDLIQIESEKLFLMTNQNNLNSLFSLSFFYMNIKRNILIIKKNIIVLK